MTRRENAIAWLAGALIAAEIDRLLAIGVTDVEGP